MAFWNRIKPLKIKAYTWDPAYLDYNKPGYKGKDTSPGWLKRLQSTVTVPKHNGLNEIYSTVQLCPGIKGFLNTPITINAWFDSEIRIHPNGGWEWNVKDLFRENMSEHPRFQIGNEVLNDRVFLKLNSPWAFVCEEDVDFLIMESFYSTNFFRENDIINPPGILNFKHQVSTNVHLACKIKPEPYNITIKMGMPLISLFPLTERPLEITYEAISGDDFQKLASFPKVNVGRYYHKLKLLRDAK